MPTDSSMEKDGAMTYDSITWVVLKLYRVRPVVIGAVHRSEPFDDGLIEFDRSLNEADLPRSKPSPTMWL